MSYACIIFLAETEHARQFAALLEILFEAEGYPIAITLKQENLPSPDLSIWSVELYVPTGKIAASIERIQQQPEMNTAKLEYTIQTFTNQDWVKQNLAELGPIHAGRFFVHGNHDKDKIPAGAISIQIDANQAFGTGHHGTTLGCLAAIDRLLKRQQFHHVLDLGTGSGILAIALAKACGTLIVASDYDAIAVDTAAENARLNGVHHAVSTLLADGFRHKALRNSAPFDLIVANILANPLIDLANGLSDRLATGGIAILSGILRHQANRVTGAYVARHFMLMEQAFHDDWATLVLRKR